MSARNRDICTKAASACRICGHLLDQCLRDSYLYFSQQYRFSVNSVARLKRNVKDAFSVLCDLKTGREVPYTTDIDHSRVDMGKILQSSEIYDVSESSHSESLASF